MRHLLGSSQPLHKRSIETEPDAGAEHVFDASKLRFVSPLDLVALASWSSMLRLDGTPVQLVLPEGVDVRRYLVRMNFASYLEQVGVDLIGEQPSIHRADRTDVLVEVRQVMDSAEAEAFTKDAYDLLVRHIGKDCAIAAAKMLGELLDNAVTHAESGTGAFAAAQVYVQRGDLELAVADCGIGVRTHLSRNPDFRNLTAPQALKSALQPGVSGTSESRGNGLSDLLRSASDYGGTMLLRSDDGYGQVTTANLNQAAFITAQAVQGTWAWVRIGLPRDRAVKLT